MKAAIIFTAVRVIEIGEPEAGQTKEEHIQLCKEATLEDPFSFLDAENVEVSCLVSELKQ